MKKNDDDLTKQEKSFLFRARTCTYKDAKLH